MLYMVISEDNELVQCFMHKPYAEKFAEQVSTPSYKHRVVAYKTPYVERQYTAIAA